MHETVVRDEWGVIDWEANGWPRPNLFFEGVEDVPDEMLEEWYDLCDFLEPAFEGED